MQLPNGTWQIHAGQPDSPNPPGTPNEILGELFVAPPAPEPGACAINSADWIGTLGYFPGPGFGGFNANVTGFWDEFAQKITFVATDPSGVTQIYTGFMFQSPQTQHFTLAGTFEAFVITGNPPAVLPGAPNGGFAERSVLGWYALL